MTNNCIVVVDVEADGPCPGLYSMVSFGAIVLDRELNKTFYAETAPISDSWIPDALAVSKVSREQHLAYPDPADAMRDFAAWLTKVSGGKRVMFFSDNNGFDWQFINYYFHKYEGKNPFGHSSSNIGSLYKGLKRDFRANFKFLRTTRHTHNPVDDARGNAEALVKMNDEYKLRLA